MKSQKLEKEVKKEIHKLLDFMEISLQILWYERLQSGVIEKYGNYVWLCRSGTPDFVVALQNKKLNLTLLFIEVKREGIKPVPRKGEQEDFFNKYTDRHLDIECMIAQSKDDVRNKIDLIGVNRLDLIQM